MADVPTTLRPIAHYVKIANENANRDPVIYYWCLYYAVQTAMGLDKSSPQAMQYLTSLLGILEQVKKQLAGNEAISQDVVAQSHIENHALKLFAYADKNDREAVFNKNVVKAYYTAGHLMDVLTLFGELEDQIAQTRKYAKWKATYIHNCLKNGETPVPGPPHREGEDANAPAAEEEDDLDRQLRELNSASGGGPTVPANIGFSSGPSFPAPSGPPQRPPPAQVAAPQQLPVPAPSGSGGQVTLDDFLEAQKYTKYAISALNYEDAKTAIENLQKAIQVLQK
uniref:Vacuolar protein sorting-associated protein VTA1 n=1 Tax=Steinernema glaseri TaxID=37863 RepID=A0A1I7Z702_9BILA